MNGQGHIGSGESGIVYLNNRQVAERLSIDRAVSCVEQAFGQLASGEMKNGCRARMTSADAALNVMWAMSSVARMAGVKSYVTAGIGKTRGAALFLLLYSLDTGALLAMLEADQLGRIRTAAATIVATRALARKGSQALAIYGTGFQAEFHVRAFMHCFPDISDLYVVSRTAENAGRFVAGLSGIRPGLQIHSGSAEEAASRADIIITATASPEPLFRAEWLKPGVHINAIGSNDPRKCELGRDVLQAAEVIVVDDLDVAATECGDLIVNAWDFSTVGTLGGLLLGSVAGRRSDDQVTLFESQGLAALDLACGCELLAERRAQDPESGAGSVGAQGLFS